MPTGFACNKIPFGMNMSIPSFKLAHKHIKPNQIFQPCIYFKMTLKNLGKYALPQGNPAEESFNLLKIRDFFVGDEE